jgi:predicted DCC family thiol-disulfide oxidoreductase YuxK
MGPAAAMFFDAHCGPCTFFARVTAGLSRTTVSVLPLDGPEADRVLGRMPDEVRFRSFHIVENGRTLSGPEAMPAWVGLVGGRSWRRVVERARPVRGLLRSGYLRAWEHRKALGCAAEAPGTE